MLARVRVTVPTKLTKAEREAIENLQKVSRENPREGLVVVSEPYEKLLERGPRDAPEP